MFTKGLHKKVAAVALASSLIFSSAGMTSAATYKVQKGDTLSKIAKQYGTTYTAIMKENNLKSTNIQIGQKLQINGKSTVSSAKTTTQASTNVVSVAKKYIGTKYRYGGVSTSGFDCSGFIYYVFKQTGKSISRQTAAGFYSKSKKVSSPKQGDLVFFSNTYKKGISHVGIYIGNGKMVSATSGSGVKIDGVKSGYWGKYFTGYGRL